MMFTPARTTPATLHDPLPPGTPVLAYTFTRDGSPLVTRTRGEAWALGSGETVVAVEGHDGGIALTHLDVLPDLGPEPHAYGVEVQVNPGTGREYWRLDDDEQVSETREGADEMREALIDMGHAPDQVRVVTIAVAS